MKTVRLPIYEDGVETDEVLEVDITFFISSHRGLRYTQAEIVPKETKDAFTGSPADKEIDLIDRIIHNLPANTNDWIGNALTRTDNTNPWREHNKREFIGEFTKPEEPIFEDFEVPFDRHHHPIEPTGRPYHDWRKIPGFEGYTMNPRKIIINEATDKTVGQESGTQGAKVLLSDEDGVGRRYSVDFLFKKTFPELNK